jgi:hypothetical protein
MEEKRPEEGAVPEPLVEIDAAAKEYMRANLQGKCLTYADAVGRTIVYLSILLHFYKFGHEQIAGLLQLAVLCKVEADVLPPASGRVH